MLKLATKFLPDAAAFALAEQAGFRCAEIWLDAALLADWEAIVRWARIYPFEYVLHFPNRLNLDPAALQHTVALYRALGCHSMVIHQPMFDCYGAALREHEPTLVLAIENHKLTLDAFDRWADASLALTLDVEHLWKYTLQDAALPVLLEHVERFLTRFGPKLRHVHLPGYWAGFAEHRPMYCAREMIFPILGLLADAAFQGLIVSEANPEYQNTHELRMDVLLFAAWSAGRETAISVSKDRSAVAGPK
jgi:hypothetical protein